MNNFSLNSIQTPRQPKNRQWLPYNLSGTPGPSKRHAAESVILIDSDPDPNSDNDTITKHYMPIWASDTKQKECTYRHETADTSCYSNHIIISVVALPRASFCER